MKSWRGGAVAQARRPFAAVAALAVVLAGAGGCRERVEPNQGGNGRNDDAAVFQACDSVCVRPSDCALAFNDDGICPPGFLCALRYGACTSD
jgi:hypothetical protein